MSRSRNLLQEEIIRVAADCFGNEGYRATTLETIAAKAGVSKVTLYKYVSSKEELLCRVFDRTIETFRRGLREIIEQRCPADETLRRTIRYQVALLAAHLPFLRVFFSEESGLPADMATRVAREKREYDRAIEKVVREGIAEGLLRDFPPTLLVFALLGMCNWMYKWYQPDGRLTPDEIAAIFVNVLEKGYLKQVEGGPEDRVLASLGRVEGEVTELRNLLRRRAQRERTRRRKRRG